MPLKSPRPFAIRVPASTSNLGPGFDGLGLALDLWNEFRITPLAKGRNALVGRGECEGLRDGAVFFKVARRVAARAGRPLPRLSVEVRGAVPMARGLGSSATGVVAGALAANRLLGDPLSLDEILALVVGVEGHPDNVSPALLGALTASARIGAATLTHQYQPHPDWRLALHVPAYALSTALARAALPARVPLADAVFNLTRTPLIVDTLVSGDARELAALLEDRLHEPYRRRSIHRYAAIRKAALEAGGAAVFLSGAGPTMAAFCMGDRAARRVADAMLAAAPRRSGAARALVLRPSLKGACVESDAAERGRAALRRR